MALITLSEAKNIAARRRPWSLRMEFVGSNPSNQSGQSAKYWFATGRGTNEAVETGHGALMAKATCHLVDFGTFEAKVAEKLQKGYDFVDANYRRMSPANLAKLGGATASAQPTPPPSNPATTLPLAQSNTPSPVVQPPLASLATLPAPFSLIASLTPTKSGYEAHDAQGDHLLTLTSDGGMKLIQDHGVPVQGFTGV